jgi:hypothetical protein
VQVSLDLKKIAVMGVVAAVVFIVTVLTWFKRIRRWLDMDGQSMIMLNLFCFLEVTLVVLASTILPFPTFAVLHQLLLAYPGNKFYEIVAAIIYLCKDTEEQLLPRNHSALKEEQVYLKDLETELKQILARLDKLDQILNGFEESLTGFQFPAHSQNSIHKIVSQNFALRSRLLEARYGLRDMYVDVHLRREHYYQLLQQLQEPQEQPSGKMK